MSFPAVLALVLQLEGVYSNDPGDGGGETVYGITRTYDAGWSGWPRVEALKSQGIQPSEWNGDVQLQLAVSSFYFALWTKYSMDKVPDALQGLVFGGIVNQGPRVVDFLQQELRDFHQMVDVDGIMGDETITALSKIEPNILFKGLWKRRAEAYREAVNTHPVNSKFLLGWLNRLKQGA